MYGLLYTLDKYYPQTKGGFVHVPFIPSQLNGRPLPAMDLEDIVQGLECSILAIAENTSDINSIEGALH
jgi:pyroglutamyl-peptidase